MAKAGSRPGDGPRGVAGSANAVAGFVNDSHGIPGASYAHQLISQDQAGLQVDNQVLIRFAAPVLGFAFISNVMNPPLGDPINPHDWPVAGMALLTLTSSSGEVFDLSSPLFSNYGSDPTVTVPYGFNGIMATVAFTSVTLSVTQGENLQLTQFSLAAVPEPASLLLWLAGLGLLGLGARRRAA